MDAYRLSGTVAPDRTITVKVPREASVGAEAEVIVLFSKPQAPPPEPHPLRTFLDNLKAEPGQQSTAEEEQAFLHELRDEWA